ncbi:MAG: thioredoxin-dependent thiol peroxidase, partial [Bdellovibrionales bacterium]|nr:thioredoxin-dependent thiol peroxidase [Bdellovibrionales bacterium]
KSKTRRKFLMAVARKKKASKKATKKPAKKQAKKSAKKAVVKSAKKVSKKTVAKPAKKAANKAVKKGASKPKPQAKAKPQAQKPVLHVVSKDSVRQPQVGDWAPQFTATTDDGSKVSLKDFAGRKVVLYFYPKDDTPGCTQEACDFRDSLGRFNIIHAVVIGVSRDDVKSHQSFKAKFGINFPLLADTSGQICEAYGVWKEKSMYGRTYMGIERTTFLIGEDGKIAKVYPGVKVGGHVDAVIEDLKSI